MILAPPHLQPWRSPSVKSSLPHEEWSIILILEVGSAIHLDSLVHAKEVLSSESSFTLIFNSPSDPYQWSLATISGIHSHPFSEMDPPSTWILGPLHSHSQCFSVKPTYRESPVISICELYNLLQPESHVRCLVISFEGIMFTSIILSDPHLWNLVCIIFIHSFHVILIFVSSKWIVCYFDSWRPVIERFIA